MLEKSHTEFNQIFHSISSVAIELGGMQQQRTTYLSYFAIFIRRKRKQTVALLQALYHDKPTYNLNQRKKNKILVNQRGNARRKSI